MKRIKYNGSLTEDINTIKDCNKGTNIYTGEKILRIALTIVCAAIAIAAIGIFIGTKKITALGPLFTSLASLLSSSSLLRSERTKNKILSIQPELNIQSLAIDLMTNIDLSKCLKEEDIYSKEEIADAVIIKRDKDDPIYKDKSSYTMEDIDTYLDTIISDIYIINASAKIKVLREIKQTLKSNKDSEKTEITNLYQLEENEMPQANEMPVKQTLELRSKRDERVRI